jgi:hypothetical protein
LIDQDPLLDKGTSTTAIGAGLGVIFSPLTDLYLGLSLDNLNQPDISLEGNSAYKPMATNFGISYRIFNLVPEFDVKHFRNSDRSETYFIFGLKQLWLDNSANLSARFRRDCFSIGSAYTFNNFRLDYNYTYPLTELQEISSGSHQFTVTYNFSKYAGYPTAPHISLLSPKVTKVDSNSFRFQSHVEDKLGLKHITILLNGENITTYNYSQEDKTISIDFPIFPLKEGENSIKIIADNDVKQSSKEINVTYSASRTPAIITSSPKIEILSPLEEETKASTLRLRLSVDFIVDMKDLKIKVNGKDIKLKGVKPVSKKKNKIDIESELELDEGMNEIELIAFNTRGTGSQKRTIRY